MDASKLEALGLACARIDAAGEYLCKPEIAAIYQQDEFCGRLAGLLSVGVLVSIDDLSQRLGGAHGCEKIGGPRALRG